MPRTVAEEALEIVGRHHGESPLVLVSDDGNPEETLCAAENPSDLYAEREQLSKPEMERVS